VSERVVVVVVVAFVIVVLGIDLDRDGGRRAFTTARDFGALGRRHGSASEVRPGRGESFSPHNVSPQN